MATQKIIYGTAWKKERTTALVVSAVLNGFRAIDTACQPKHYREDLVGEALKILQERHDIKREDLFIQTKFTPIGGQDQSKPLPYDPSTRLETQINDSFQKTITAWRALITLQDSGKVKTIGVSNTYDVATLEALERDGGRKVQVVQNRWFEGNHWDPKVLQYCKEHGVQYQSFWTLSGAPNLLAHQPLVATAMKHGCTPEQALFKLAQIQGVTPLSGTTDEKHMQEDIVAGDLDVEPEEFSDVLTWMGLK